MYYTGGGTGFIYPGYHQLVEPEKGSAAFWIDLRASGLRDDAATHGGCPILKGSKWILNKWIRYYKQWKEIPCGLHIRDFVLPYEGVY